MGKSSDPIISELKTQCRLAGIDFEAFMGEVRTGLMNRIKDLFTPNTVWFAEGKSLERYWGFLEKTTGHALRYEYVDCWYKMLRNPSETREEIPASLRYDVIASCRSTCQKCGRSAPIVSLEVDHIVPWSCGGPTVRENLQCLCTECNRGKSGKCFE